MNSERWTVRARRLLVTVLVLGALAAAQVISGGGGSGNATKIQGVPVAPSAPSNGTCLVYSSSSGQWQASSCAGTASAAWSALTSGTNTIAAMIVGTGASLAASGTGTIAATSVPAAGLGAGTIGNATSGNAATATALAAAGTACAAGSYARGVDASGNASGCTVAAGGTIAAGSVGSPAVYSGTTALGGTANMTFASDPGVTVQVTAANRVPLKVNAFSGTTSDIVDWAVNGTVLGNVDSAGAVHGANLYTAGVVSAAGLATNSSGEIVAAAAPPFVVNTGLGDGLNAIPAGTYAQTWYNGTGHTLTLSGIKCYTDNGGTSTMSVTNGSGTALLTAAITCTASWAAGTQSATVTLAAGDYFKFSFTSDGASKQTTWVIEGTY